MAMIYVRMEDDFCIKDNVQSKDAEKQTRCNFYLNPLTASAAYIRVFIFY